MNELINDPTFMGFIGEYRFDDGTQADAIVILGSAEFVDGLANCSGLECVISRIPTVTSSPVYNGCIPTHKVWTIHLIQYETGNDALTAADYIVQRYPGTGYSNVGIESMSEVAGVVQLAVTIPANVNL